MDYWVWGVADTVVYNVLVLEKTEKLIKSDQHELAPLPTLGGG